MPKKSHSEHHPHVAPKAPPEAAQKPVGAEVPPDVGVEPESLAHQPEAGAGAAAPAVPTESGSPAMGGAAAAPEDAARLAREAADLKDRLLRTAADFDNYRKRATREKAESWDRGQADVVLKVLEGLDDLGRVAHLDPAQTTVEALHEGVALVERKVLKALEGIGVERLDPSGEPFDPNAHEAVMTTPAPGPERDGHVAMVFQAGYRLRGTLLRPARVAVYAFTEPLPGGEVVN
jgi:molecular chaperone GrpE